MEYTFPVLFLFTLLAALTMVGSYLWIESQVRRAGEKLGLSRFHPNYDRVLHRKYREIARTRQLPFWPVHLYWAGVFGTIILGCGLMMTIHK